MAVLKFYVHFDKKEPKFTKIFRVENPNTTIGDIKREFIECYNKKHGETRVLLFEESQILDDSKKGLNDKHLVSQSISEMTDLYFVSENDRVELIESTDPQTSSSSSTSSSLSS
eukprot:TRINITY_DN946_c0_g4_i2.p1 TRINITY_DN946_c0_g4~~TRINITY_DN946_c0_g4_i2.p1  ORF type:complete len:114 (-),score=44.78 TRINITY_DN946_c0_g4_i2:32-373(-)